MISEIGRILLERWIFPMVKVGKDFSTPIVLEELSRLHESREYDKGFSEFLERFLLALSRDSWAPGSYYPGGWYRQLTARGDDPSTAEISPQNLAPFYLEEIMVTPEGNWLNGKKPIQGKVLHFFLANLHFHEAIARYRIRYRVEDHFECRYIHHRSPPFRVERARSTTSGIELMLNNGQRETLRPETLWMDEKEHLYCAVMKEGLPAWFSEPARWEFLKDAEEGDGGWKLNLAGRIVELRSGIPWPFKDLPPE